MWTDVRTDASVQRAPDPIGLAGDDHGVELGRLELVAKVAGVPRRGRRTIEGHKTIGVVKGLVR